MLVTAGAIAVACIATAASLGPDRIVDQDFSVALLALGLLAPGIVVLVGASRMPRQPLRESWGKAERLRRFRGGMRAALVPAATARGHVAEIEQALASAGSTADSPRATTVALDEGQHGHAARHRRARHRD